MSQPGFIQHELDQTATELESLLHSRRRRALGGSTVNREQPPYEIGPVDRQAKGDGGTAGLGDDEGSLDAHLVERAGHALALGPEGVVGLLGMRG